MPGGVYSALSGMQVRLGELDRLAADLANVGTAGYKTERDATFAAERDRFQQLLDSAVDVTTGGSRVDLRAGALATTGRDLDVAIQGDGFFVIDTAAGPRYTRNGNFTRRADGVLATMDGDAVLGRGGPITLGPGALSMAEDGTIRTGATVAGTLRIVALSAGQLVREGGTRFTLPPGVTPADVADPRVVNGALEQANVTAVDRMVALTEVQRGFEALQRGISVLMNDVEARAISDLGRR